jgi:hypothetical protein
LQHLIKFYTIQQKYLEFKNTLDREFDNDRIKYFLECLGIDGLYENLYCRKYEINGQLVMYDYDSETHDYMLSNGSANGTELKKNMPFLLTDFVNVEEREHHICFQFQDISIPNKLIEQLIPRQDIISDMNSYYVQYSTLRYMKKDIAEFFKQKEYVTNNFL